LVAIIFSQMVGQRRCADSIFTAELLGSGKSDFLLSEFEIVVGSVN